MSQPVTWGAPRTERADAARNREILLAAAREIVAGRGADKLTMDGLAARARLGKGTVFRRFGNRAMAGRTSSSASAGQPRPGRRRARSGPCAHGISRPARPRRLIQDHDPRGAPHA